MLARLVSSGRPVRIAAEGAGAAVFARHGLPLAAGAATGRWERVLTGSSLRGGPEMRAVASARDAGVPSVTLLDSWTNYRSRFEAPAPASGTTLPDAIAVMDGFARDEMIALGFPAERLHVTGQPAFDALVGIQDAAARRMAARAALGVRDRSRLVLFFSQPIREIDAALPAGARRGYDEEDAWGLLESVCSRTEGVDLRLRPHPRSPPKAAAASVPEAFRTTDLLLAADVVAGMSSIALVQGAILGRPVVSVQPGLRGPDPLVLGRMGALAPARDAREIEERLAEAREGRAPDVPISWKRGGAADRVLDLLLGARTASAARHI